MKNLPKFKCRGRDISILVLKYFLLEKEYHTTRIFFPILLDEGKSFWLQYIILHMLLYLAVFVLFHFTNCFSYFLQQSESLSNCFIFLIDFHCKPELSEDEFVVQQMLQMAVKRLSAEEKGCIFLNEK